MPIEAEAIEQLSNLARLPIVHRWVAAMPDVHLGIGATVGSVIPTLGAIIPADSPIAHRLSVERTPVVTILFLPAFFALTGLLLRDPAVGVGELLRVERCERLADRDRVSDLHVDRCHRARSWERNRRLGHRLDDGDTVEQRVDVAGRDRGLPRRRRYVRRCVSRRDASYDDQPARS